MNSNSRIRKRNKYTTVSNAAVLDRRLSLKAKGLLLLLLSRPDGWQFRVSWLIEQSRDGRDATRGAIRELEETGYLERRPAQDDQGKFTGVDWFITDEPSDGKPVEREIRRTGFLADHTKTEGSKTEKTKTEQKNPPLNPPPIQAATSTSTEVEPPRLPQRSSPTVGPVKSSAAPPVDNLPSWIPAELWAEWEQHRREKRKALTPTTRRKQIEALERWREKYGERAALSSLEASIRNGWIGIFEPKAPKGRGESTYSDRVRALMGAG